MGILNFKILILFTIIYNLAIILKVVFFALMVLSHFKQWNLHYQYNLKYRLLIMILGMLDINHYLLIIISYFITLF